MENKFFERHASETTMKFEIGNDPIAWLEDAMLCAGVIPGEKSKAGSVPLNPEDFEFTTLEILEWEKVSFPE